MKLCGSYGVVDNGGMANEVLSDLTGGVPLRFKITPGGEVTMHDKAHKWPGSAAHQHEQLFHYLRMRSDGKGGDVGDDLVCCSRKPDDGGGAQHQVRLLC